MVKHPELSDFLYFVALLVVVVIVMVSFNQTQIIPISQALECTCLKTGEHCYESKAFGVDFWNQYWSQDVPNVFAEVNQLRYTGVLPLAGGASVPVPAPAASALSPAPAPASLAASAATALAAAVRAPAEAVVFHRKTGRRHHHRH